MSTLSMVKTNYEDLLAAIHFLTRIPVPLSPHRPYTLSHSVKFFPLVGLLIGLSAGFIHVLVAPHLSRLQTSLILIIFLLLLTGCLHEDGLADAADGFGGGWNQSQIIMIMRDSRIGTYGAAALALSLLARILLLSSIAIQDVMAYLIVAHVLSRWTALPLGFYLPSTTSLDPVPGNQSQNEVIDRQGIRVASMVTRDTLIWGTLISFTIVGIALRFRSLAPISSAIGVTLLSGLFYKRKLGGITGDCFGASNQITEITVYLVGAWIV